MLTEDTAPDVLDLIAETRTAAFAIDRFDRIIYWNAGATQLLGHEPETVLGRFCFDAIQGRDLFGNRYCAADCPVVTGAAAGETQEPFLLDTASLSGDRKTLRVRAFPLPAPGPAFRCLMHLLEPEDGTVIEDLLRRIRHAAVGVPVSPEPPEPALSASPLTTRENEILSLLSKGHLSLSIAARLDLSHVTARNHIQNILRKIDAHSQVEAIAMAYRRGWVTAS